MEKKGYGGIMDITCLPSVLLDHGTVLEKHCPLSETLQVTRFNADEGVTVYKPSKVRVRSLYDKEFKDDVDRFHRFHGSLIHQIEVGCATARIPIYPSYYKLKREGNLLSKQSRVEERRTTWAYCPFHGI